MKIKISNDYERELILLKIKSLLNDDFKYTKEVRKLKIKYILGYEK